HGHICLYSAWSSSTRVVGGIPFEMGRRVADAGYGVCTNSSADFEVEGMKLVLEQMAEECGCKVLYYTFFCDTVVEDGAAVAAVVQNKGGRRLIRAKRIVDCTGDGDVAAHAGCPFDVGDAERGLCQPVTLMFTIGGVDWKRVCEFRKGDYKLSHVWKQAQANGDMRPWQDQIMGWWWTPTRPDQVGCNFTHVNFINSTRAEDLTKATLEGRKQAYEAIQVYRKYIPGMEGCYMVSTPNTVGVRESRRIRGEYTLTRDDVMSQRRFPDSIGYGSFFIDIHSVSGPGMDGKTWRPPKDFRYQIPYRILVPKDVDNLLVAGRCASCDHEALGSLRVMPQCGVMGQAAGAASALSLRQAVPPREINVGSLQAELRRQGCILDEDGIKRIASPGKAGQ
ncbi:MAG: FAD-dependent oxidoreductase, partial [Planctomycetes bacterium]|nr:FAD-dependent oxidoreductase [Planctomycetota bacterium]